MKTVKGDASETLLADAAVQHAAPVCWVVTDGKQGTENQCLGLAEALGLSPVVKRIALRAPWRQLTPYMRVGLGQAVSESGDSVAPPWPDILIASGRQSTAVSINVKRRAGDKCLVVQIQDPRCDPALFDLVVVPQHDRLRGPNVLVTHGALNRVTSARLEDAVRRFSPRYAHLPRNRVAVLIGGRNKIYDLDPMRMGDVVDQLAEICKRHEAGLLVTASRRTGGENAAILKAKLRDLPAEIWDGEGENPYFAFLGMAGHIIVTADSVSMISEACSTGKPVYIADLDGGSPKFDRFHRHLMAVGAARPFEGMLDDWGYEALNDTAEVAAEIADRLAAMRRG
jgi:mitochondrial fission protein ELM1